MNAPDLSLQPATGIAQGLIFEKKVMASSVISQILEHKVIAIIRGYRVTEVIKLGSVLSRNGIKMIEVTLNSPYAFSSISKLNNHLGSSVIIGAGTVLTVDEVKKAYDVGAKLIISPNTDKNVIAKTRELGMVSIPGALTPTEIVKAHQAGADIVKLFPASLGISYFIGIRAPLNNIPMIPTGGIDITNMKSYWDAGASAFGIGDSLIPSGLELTEDELSTIGKNAAAYVKLAKSFHR
jgi:2-dehydro-3-deoxyphosphogluconate aldolase/(4S)-4-hydroxy-2-oxoglutarate aldolase